jgi:hypothetical protein
MQRYDYPPSGYIKKFEPFEPNSHFYVRGNCHFEGKKYRCEFEVAYTLNGNIYIVAYFKHRVLLELFGIPVSETSNSISFFVSKKQSICVDFSGKDARYGLQVQVSKAISISSGMGAPERPTVFTAEKFTLVLKDPYVLENHPLTSDFFEFELVNVSNPLGLFNDYEFASDPPLRLRFPKENEKENAILIVPRQAVPASWDADVIADMWCSAITLATGIDVNWILKYSRTPRSIICQYKRRSTIVRHRKTYGVIAANPFWEQDKNLHVFVSKIFEQIQSGAITMEAAREYSRIMRLFVEYQLISNRAETHARLLTTTVEELVGHWERFNKQVVKSAVTSADADKIWGHLQPFIEKSFPAENRDKIKERLATACKQEIVRPSFKKRLLNIFDEGKNSEEWIKKCAESKIKDFVDTRNKIVHEGRFSDKNSGKILQHYYNMIMILPLLIFSVFGYDGQFIDLGEKYKKINNPEGGSSC